MPPRRTLSCGGAHRGSALGDAVTTAGRPAGSTATPCPRSTEGPTPSDPAATPTLVAPPNVFAFLLRRPVLTRGRELSGEQPRTLI